MKISKLAEVLKDLSRPLPLLQSALNCFTQLAGQGLEEAMFFYFLALFEGKQ